MAVRVLDAPLACGARGALVLNLIAAHGVQVRSLFCRLTLS